MSSPGENTASLPSHIALPSLPGPKILTDGWAKTSFLLLLGYLTIGRTFAYIGIPPWHIFIGEVVLGLFMVSGPRTLEGRWVWDAVRWPALRRLVKLFLVSLAYGVIQVIHGISAGYPALTAIRDLAFNYYPVYFLVGLWVGLRDPGLLARFFRAFAWFNGIYGIAYILFLNHVTWVIPGVSDEITQVLIFGLPDYSFVVLLGLLAYEQNLRRVWHLIFLNAFVMLGMQVRAEWLALAVGLGVWVWTTKRFKKMLVAVGIVILLITIMYVADFKIQGPETRGVGVISARDLVGRAMAPLHANFFGTYGESDEVEVNTVVWRTVWWAAIWNAVHEDHKRELLGFGYGYPLGDLVPYLEGEFLQTPHNVFFYALGYTGWIGVFVFFLFQIQILRLLWNVHLVRGQPFGIVFFLSAITYGFFTPFFEAPYGAIPFYLIGGIVSSGLFRGAERRLKNLPGG